MKLAASKQERISVTTAGHLATCPRMLKAADALHEAGYRVRVISASPPCARNAACELQPVTGGVRTPGAPLSCNHLVARRGQLITR